MYGAARAKLIGSFGKSQWGTAYTKDPLERGDAEPTVCSHIIPKKRRGVDDALTRLMARDGIESETSTPETASVAC